MIRHPERRAPAAGWLAAAALLLAPPGPAAAQGPNAMSGFTLSPGVYVDRDKGNAYVMNPGGGIDAVKVADGQKLWTSDAASRPLGMTNDRLVSQVAAAEAQDRLRFVAIDTASGRPVGRAVDVPLPPGVRPTVQPTPHGRFEVNARPSDGETIVSWEYHPRPLRGVPPGADRRLAPPRPPRAGGAGAPKGIAPLAPSSPHSGAYRINLSEGTATRVAPPPIPLQALAAQEAAPAKWIAGAEGEQSLSADGRHVLVSRLTGDDTVWDNYTHTVHVRETGRVLGAFKSHQASVPFGVVDGRALYETSPYTRRTAAGVDDQPLTLRAVDLASGREVWSRPVRDATYRGPLPP